MSVLPVAILVTVLNADLVNTLVRGLVEFYFKGNFFIFANSELERWPLVTKPGTCFLTVFEFVNLTV